MFNICQSPRYSSISKRSRSDHRGTADESHVWSVRLLDPLSIGWVFHGRYEKIPSTDVSEFRSNLSSTCLIQSYDCL